MAAKGRLADMSALETLYGAARDELQRLDKENLELKDMVAAGGVQLGRSRILEALGIPDDGPAAAAAKAAGRRAGGGQGRPGSPALLGYGPGSGSAAGSGQAASGSGRSRSAPRARRTSSLPAGECRVAGRVGMFPLRSGRLQRRVLIWHACLLTSGCVVCTMVTERRIISVFLRMSSGKVVKHLL